MTMGVLDKHLRLQNELSETCGVNVLDKEGALVVSCLAGIDEFLEVVEFVKDKTKPWKRPEFNLGLTQTEAIDVYHFLLQIFNILEMDEELIDKLYREKRNKNFDRVQEKMATNGNIGSNPK